MLVRGNDIKNYSGLLSRYPNQRITDKLKFYDEIYKSKLFVMWAKFLIREKEHLVSDQPFYIGI